MKKFPDFLGGCPYYGGPLAVRTAVLNMRLNGLTDHDSILRLIRGVEIGHE
ncbi:MAG: hypothetical protein JSW35_10045 [Deltaproteobacteria bacterium]|nr:MAG: hypothetical protein JSW35_10045 [Deltaproteobacteria bacterium]